MNRARRSAARARALDPADLTAGPAACDVARADARETERVRTRAGGVVAVLVGGGSPRPSRRGAGTTGRRGGAAHDARGGDGTRRRRRRAWEALGASYDAMDKHSAALKAYRKAMDVESSDLRLGSATRVYASTRSGRLILETEGDLDAAVAAHAAALAAAPGHPAAALGLAEAETAREGRRARGAGARGGRGARGGGGGDGSGRPAARADPRRRGARATRTWSPRRSRFVHSRGSDRESRTVS